MARVDVRDQRRAQGRQQPLAFAAIGLGRRGGYVVLAFLIMAVVLLGISGVVLASNGSHAAHSSSSVPQWRRTLTFVVIAIGMALDVLGMVRLFRTGVFSGRGPSAFSVLDRRQKMQVKREVMGLAPLDPAHLAPARDLARQMTHLRVFTVVLIGFVVMELGGSITFFAPEELLQLASSAALVVVSLLTTYRNSLLGQRFLDHHPADRTE